MKKNQRNNKDMIEAEGLIVASFVTTVGSHFKYRVRAGNGKEMNLVTANTPSCNRASLNNRSILRRFAAENGKVNHA